MRNTDLIKSPAEYRTTLTQIETSHLLEQYETVHENGFVTHRVKYFQGVIDSDNVQTVSLTTWEVTKLIFHAEALAKTLFAQATEMRQHNQADDAVELDRAGAAVLNRRHDLQVMLDSRGHYCHEEH